MRKIILFIFLCIVSLITYAQSYSSNFQSAQQIRQYLAANIDKLDPAEGEYDVNLTYAQTVFVDPFDIYNFDMKWVTKEFHCILFFIKVPSSNYLIAYNIVNGNFFKGKHLKMESIGTTNAYRLYWNNSSGRAYLDNSIRISSRIELSKQDGKTFFQNPQYNGPVILQYDMVKKYPTGQMYAEATRKAAEERAQAEIPKDWSGTGFALNNGYIVTNYHVIENAKTIKIQGVGATFL